MNFRKYFLILLTFLPAASYAQKSSTGSYTFPKDKSSYYGELESGKPNGKGKTIFVNGDSYEGEYVKGMVYRLSGR